VARGIDSLRRATAGTVAVAGRAGAA